MVVQLGFVFNAENCIGCRACEIACRNENNTSREVFWRTVKRLNDDSYLSSSCYHCSSPECFRVCPENAFIKRNDGIVMIDTNRCSGCQLCVHACPYGAPQYDFYTQKVSKCQMCYHRQDQGLEPACVEACTTKSLTIANMMEIQDQNLVRSIVQFPDTRITKPSVAFYPAKEKVRFFINK